MCLSVWIADCQAKSFPLRAKMIEKVKTDTRPSKGPLLFTGRKTTFPEADGKVNHKLALSDPGRRDPELPTAVHMSRRSPSPSAQETDLPSLPAQGRQIARLAPRNHAPLALRRRRRGVAAAQVVPQIGLVVVDGRQRVRHRAAVQLAAGRAELVEEEVVRLAAAVEALGVLRHVSDTALAAVWGRGRGRAARRRRRLTYQAELPASYQCHGLGAGVVVVLGQPPVSVRRAVHAAVGRAEIGRAGRGRRAHRGGDGHDGCEGARHGFQGCRCHRGVNHDGLSEACIPGSSQAAWRGQGHVWC